MSVKQKPIVVLADDDESVLMAMRVVLGQHYDLRSFSTAEAAVQEIRNSHPACVILDIKMPVHDGFWAFSQIRTFDTKVPIIFNSAYQDALPKADLAAGFKPFGYLTKTGNLREFLALVKLAVIASTGNSEPSKAV